jgi:1-pyrroline dehydrogenase
MASAVTSLSNIVGGEPVAAREGAELEVLNPASGEPIASVPAAGEADVDLAVEAAARAFPAWRDTLPRDRSRQLAVLADRLEERLGEFVQLELENVGKPLTAARGELPMAVDTLRFFAGACRTLGADGSGEFIAGTTSIVRREPHGVVASLGPWNYPLQTLMMKIAPAMAAGNTVVAKPSKLAPLTTVRFAELAAEVLPPGVLNVITGEGSVVGEALVRHPRVRFVSLTGDTGTGRRVAEAAGATLTLSHLELGGNAPMIVLEDADLDAAVSGAVVGGYYNAGQDCTASARLLVADAVYDDFVAALQRAVEAMVVDDPAAGEQVEMGPVISADHRTKVLGFLERAEAGGATLLTGGAALERAGFFVAPSLVADAGQEDEIIQDEVFGPVMTVQRFGADTAALELANGVEQGLAASVWTNDLSRAHEFARLLDFGTVWINEHLPFAPEAPFGGFGSSGYGAEMSAHGLHEYTRLKHVLARLRPLGSS